MTQNTKELRFRRTQYLALPERAELASALGLTQVLTTYTLHTETYREGGSDCKPFPT